jgi:putative ABC transport system permease protein
VAAQRTVGIGVRVALGATRARIAVMILRDGVRIITVGCLFGGVAAWAVGRLLQTVIAGQTVFTPAVLGGVACLLLVVGMSASARPARRASSADPLEALRHE